MPKRMIAVCSLLIIVFSSPIVYGAESPEIEWELINPFRFIHETEFYDKTRSIYDSFSLKERTEKPSLTLEKRLQQAEFKGESYVRNGWAASIAKDNYQSTCWDASSATYKSTGVCKDYIHPVGHDVMVWLNSTNLKSDANCEWSYGGNKVVTLCSEKHIITDVPYPTGLLVNVSITGDSQIKFSKNIIVQDELVVGLGDSYASGEGNPDIPVTFHEGRSNKDRILTKNWYTPRKDKGKSAVWLDRRSHRSLYSYQFKVALLMAIENPKRAITFLSYSCSGAKMKHIIGSWKSAVENKKMKWKNREAVYDAESKTYINDRKFKVRPQIEALARDIKCPPAWRGKCQKGMREIDYLLLSIGGNDIGFSKYVINIATSKKSIMNKLAGKKPGKSLDKDFRKLIQSYQNLNDVMIAKLPIKNCDNTECQRVLLTNYPNILNDENGKLCSDDKGAFYIPFGNDSNRGKRISETFEKVIKPLANLQNRLSEQKVYWSIINEHNESYKKHGICAQLPESPSIANETFIIPHKKRKSEPRWRSFDPKQYRLYGEMQRWVRLPVDSKLSINLTKGGLDLFFSDESSGIVHPTAIGHSVIADANSKKIRNLN